MTKIHQWRTVVVLTRYINSFTTYVLSTSRSHHTLNGSSPLSLPRYFREQRLRYIGINKKNNLSQVEFAESKETADDRANIDGTVIGAPIVGQYSAQYYIWSDHQNADCTPMIGLVLSRQLLVCLSGRYVPANIVSSIIGLLVFDRCLGYYRSTNLRFIKASPILSLSFIHRPSIFNISALVELSFIDWSLFVQRWTDNQVTLYQPIFDLLKWRKIPIWF